MGFSGPTCVCRYTMVGFGFKINRLHAMVVLFIAHCLPTNILALAKWSSCIGAKCITVKLMLLHGLSIQVVSNIGCTVLGHIQCVRKTWCGFVRSGYWRWTLPFSNNRLQNSSTCHNMFNYISWTHCGPTTKIFSHIDYNPIIIHRKIKEFKAVFFEILRIEFFNEMLKNIN